MAHGSARHAMKRLIFILNLKKSALKKRIENLKVLTSLQSQEQRFIPAETADTILKGTILTRNEFALTAGIKAQCGLCND